ncbi:GLUG motif-containing protein [Pseudomonas sp. LD120]|uniref:two-partner secretion domain-containing protein n=1 Tax=Pseudomonas sp. LD120 TaxID=485751 RepID=UPI001357CEC4|nr:GLUG motif-containing protein [Pseudomonas sp. LD120]KAF0863436.1 filamentous hemagglutinin N-terminal domain-containing protein [Pseudomonas sp. LD120]
MNKIYAVVWNQAQGCWNVTCEGARRRRRSGGRKGLLVMAAGLLSLGGLTPAMALPEGGTLLSGSASYDVNGNNLVIHQKSDKLITNWTDFNIGADQSVTFNQPGRDSVALNRVTGFKGSNIQGALNANGQVFLINPNGVLISQGAQVNVGGLVASTRGISDQDFKDGRYQFSGNSTVEVINDGKITTAEGGYVALLGARVRNNGEIVAEKGSVALGAGNDFTLSMGDDNLINLQVSGAAVDALVQNTALLKADGGQVLMMAKSANAVAQAVVNNQGVVEANTLSSKGGRIVLDGGDRGVVNVGGQLTAKALGMDGDGGTIETVGANTRVELNAQVDTRSKNGRTGTWVVESDEIKIGSTGVPGSPTVVDTTLSQSLNNTSVHLRSRNGDVAVDAPVEWKSGNQLTLSAAKDVKVNKGIKATGNHSRLELNAGNSIRLPSQVSLTGANSSLELNYGDQLALGDKGKVTLSGRDAEFTANGKQHQVIQNSQQLQAIGNQLDGAYVLGNQINGSETINSIGGDKLFTGSLNGLGNTISGFTVNSSGMYAGLFGQSSGSISHLKLASITVNGQNSQNGFSEIGGLVGRNSGSISHVSASNMQVNADSEQRNKVGGLVGVNLGGSISDVSVSGTMFGGFLTSAIGGVVGENSFGNLKPGTVSRSSSNVEITTHMHKQAMGGAGGLVGVNNGGSISESSSKGSIGTYKPTYKGLNVGGLVGNNQGGTITDSSSSMTVHGSLGSHIGGLVGLNQSGVITGSNASGNVYGVATETAGGLVGLNQNQSSLSNVKATGEVIDRVGSHLGGLVGKNDDSAIRGYIEAKGAVKGGVGGNVGGLVGTNIGGFIYDAKARGAVEGYANSRIGGLIGYNDGNLLSVEAHGSVFGDTYSSVGGLVGFNANYKNHVIERGLATGNVHGTWKSKVGGLVGENQSLIVNSDARGRVKGGWRTTMGGLVGVNEGDIRGSKATGPIDSCWAYFQTYGSQIGINHGTYSSARVPSSLSPLASLTK